MKKTLPPIGITNGNKPLGPEGNTDGQCCGKGLCGCGPEVTAGGGSACGCRKRSFCPVMCFVIAVLMAGAIAYAGCAIGHGISSLAENARVVTVRGLAEREVKADLALWNIGYVATGNDLNALQAKVEGDSETIRAFLKQAGLTDEAIIELPTNMVDLMSRDYRSEGADQSRYIVNAGLRVRTDQVDLVKELSGLKIGALIKAGVTLREGQPPEYIFTKLKEAKPEMVAEATEDARRAASQFAKDSGAKLGAMKTASQGVFQFLPRDAAQGVMENYEINKTLRVVTSTEYFLVD
jgi:hypothetical protein